MIKYSLVVPTYNRSALLKINLEALSRQSADPNDFEIIVVNDGSGDDTDMVVNNFAAHNQKLNFKYIKKANGGPGSARNIGIQSAKGQFIFFTDDDCVVPENWIKVLADGYARHPEAAGVGSWYDYTPQQYEKNVFVRYWMHNLRQKYGQNFEVEISSNAFNFNPAGNTSSMSYKKDILKEMNGFDEDFSFPAFDDWDLKKRVMDKGYPLLYIPLPVLHIRPLGFYDIAKRLFNFGRGRYHFNLKNRELNGDRQSKSIALAIHKLRTSTEKGLPIICLIIGDLILSNLGWYYQILHEKKAKYNTRRN